MKEAQKGRMDLSFYKTLICLAFPIVIQSLLSSCLGMVDTVMISWKGEASIAAVGLANQYFFTFAMIVAGLGSSCSLFISQYFGKDDWKNIQKIIGITLIAVLIFSVPFTLATGLFASQIISIFTPSKELIDLGARYLRIIALTVLPFCLNSVFAAALRSTRQSKIPMVSSIAALITNTILNYILIFGKFGFPELGIEGAAIATLIARLVECGINIAIVYLGENEIAVGFKCFFGINKALVKNYIQCSIHMILNDWLYSLAGTVYMVAYAHMGKEALAALNIAGTVQNILFVLISGFATASAILVGGDAGQDEMERAYTHGKMCLKFSVAFGVLNSILLFLISPKLLLLFPIMEDTYKMTVALLYVYAAIIAVRYFNFVSAAGVLRGGGDTKWTMMLELATVWLLAVPMAFAGVYWFKLPIEKVVALVMLEEVVKCVFMFYRFTSRRWLNNLTKES